MAPTKIPLNFDPSAALLLNQATITITVDMLTGEITMKTNRPDFNFLAVIDLLATQIQTVCRQALIAVASGKPGFLPPVDGGNLKQNEKASTEGTETS